jgi:DNA polymerase III gamma/tau subunit
MRGNGNGNRGRKQGNNGANGNRQPDPNAVVARLNEELLQLRAALEQGYDEKIQTQHVLHNLATAYQQAVYENYRLKQELLAVHQEAAKLTHDNTMLQQQRVELVESMNCMQVQIKDLTVETQEVKLQLEDAQARLAAQADPAIWATSAPAVRQQALQRDPLLPISPATESPLMTSQDIWRSNSAAFSPADSPAFPTSLFFSPSLSGGDSEGSAMDQGPSATSEQRSCKP